MSNLLEIGGQNYFIDFKNIELLLSSGASFKGGVIKDTETTEIKDSDGKVTQTTVVTREYYKDRQVDMFRFETVGEMVGILLDNQEESNGITKSFDSESTSFKLAFNTLLEYGILNIAEDEE